MTLNRLIQTFALTSLLGIASGSLAGETYFKCTKADNTITYTETKPTAATACTDIEEIRVSTGRGTPGAHQGNTESTNEAAQKGVTDRETAELKAKAQEACDKRRTNLETLKTSTAITVKDAAGNSKALSVEEIQQRIKETEEYIRDFCSQ